MNYAHAKITYPKELEIVLGKTGKKFVEKIKIAAAIELYSENSISLGKAAKLAEMNYLEFIRELGKRKISIYKIKKDELLDDIKNA